MKSQVFVVRDSKSQAFGNPFFFPTVGVAVRSISDEVNATGRDSMLSAHPEDFELFHLGEFDPISCLWDLFPSPKPVVVCAQLKTNGKGV